MQNPEADVHEALTQRVRELEGQVRMMKELGAGALVFLLIFLVLQFHDHRKMTTGQLVAHSVTLIDSNGTARARLAVFPEGSGLEAYAPSGERRLQLVGSGDHASLNLNIPVSAEQDAASINLLHNNDVLSSLRSGPYNSVLEMHSKPANGSASLSLQGTTASLSLSGADEKVPKIILSADRSQACTILSGVEAPSAGGSLCLHSPGLPSLELADVVGNRAVVGIPHSADLNKEEGSAASVILKHSSGSKVHMTPKQTQ